MDTNDDAGPPLDLVGRSWAAFGIGVGLMVVGAIILYVVARSIAPAPIPTSVGAVMAGLGGMTVQASIVGFVFGSYDGVRRRRQPDDLDDGIGTSQRRVAGWYPDPDDATIERWWDGGRWTQRRPHADPT